MTLIIYCWNFRKWKQHAHSFIIISFPFNSKLIHSAFLKNLLFLLVLIFTPTYFENFCQYLTYNHNLFRKDPFITFATDVPCETSDFFSPQRAISQNLPGNHMIVSFYCHLEKRMATHSSILAWRIPWTKNPDGQQSMGSQRVGHNWATNAFNTTSISWPIYSSIPTGILIFNQQMPTNTDSVFALMRVSSGGYW